MTSEITKNMALDEKIIDKSIKDHLKLFPFNILFKLKISKPFSGIVKTKTSKNRIAKLNEKLNGGHLALNIGSGSTNYGTNFVNIDIDNFLNVNVKGDAHSLPFKTESFNFVVIQGVLEHIKNPELVIQEIYRILNPEGYVFAEIPFIQAYHPDPMDFQRYTVQGIDELFHQYNKKEIGVAVGPASGFVWIAKEFFAVLFSLNNLILYKAFRWLFSWLLAPIAFFDLILERSKFAGVVASSIYYLGQKKEEKNVHGK